MLKKAVYFFCFLSISVFGQENGITVFQSLTPDSNSSDLDKLDSIVLKKKVIGFGEATHATKEFYEIRYRIFRHLVEKEEVSVLGLEASFSECLALNEYVLNGKGDPRTALLLLGYKIYNIQELLDCVMWMRSYNEDPRHLKKVKFYGFDIPYSKAAGEFLLDYLSKVKYDTEFIDEKLKINLADFDSKKVNKLPATFDEFVEEVEKLKDLFQSNKRKWTKITSEKDFDLAEFNLSLIDQYVQRLVKKNERDVVGYMNHRDSCMAENIKRILSWEEKGSRMVVWSHNLHLQKSDKDGVRQAGFYLEDLFGDQFYSVASDFRIGKFRAITGKILKETFLEEIPKNSIAAKLTQFNPQSAFYDFQSMKINQDLFNSKMEIHRIGLVFVDAKGAFTKIDLKKDYDGLIFIYPATHSTTPLK